MSLSRRWNVHQSLPSRAALQSSRGCGFMRACDGASTGHAGTAVAREHSRVSPARASGKPLTASRQPQGEANVTPEPFALRCSVASHPPEPSAASRRPPARPRAAPLLHKVPQTAP